MKLYDIWFRLAQPMVTTVEASNKEEAKEKFLEQFEEMDKNQILSLFKDALDFNPDSVTIESIDLINQD